MTCSARRWTCWAVPDVLAFDQVSRCFGGGGGVTDVSFAIAAGEIVALIGLNGAGKTTLMRLALGMLRSEQGEVRLFGAPLAALPAAAWAQVGALIEVPLAYPELTVRDNLRSDAGCTAAIRGGSTRLFRCGSSARSQSAGSVGCRSETGSAPGWRPRCSTTRG